MFITVCKNKPKKKKTENFSVNLPKKKKKFID